jgi:hypothetical protein
MTIKELRKQLDEIDPIYDDCEVAVYEVYGTLGYANVVTQAYVGKTYVNQGYPIRRMFQIQFELPEAIREEIRNKTDI